MNSPADDSGTPVEEGPSARQRICGLDDSIGYLARRVFWPFVSAVERRISKCEISVGQYVVLRHLWISEGFAQHQLSAELQSHESTVAVAVRKLEDRGFVRREKNEINRREILVYLTQAGRDLRHSLGSVSTAVNGVATKDLSDDEIVQLHSLLRRVADNLASDQSMSISRP